MPLLLAGIDEAGYGPTLGPMCIGLSIWRINTWDQPDLSPNLWKLLAPHITRKPPSAASAKKPSSPIAIADSKLLKRPNDGTAVHPLTHLERGVLAALACTPLSHSEIPADDLALLSRIARTTIPADAPTRWCTDSEHWYDTDPTPLPLASDPGHLRIAINLFQRALHSASIQLLDMRCRIVPESEFNSIVHRTRNKSEVTLAAVGEHLRHIHAIAAQFPADHIQVVCDRLGGREFYGPRLEELLPGAKVARADESPDRSRYWLDHHGRELGVLFQVEAEQTHMPVALASMLAKLLRELAMTRFNRYFCRRAVDLSGTDLKPTAGYSTDARRWLADASPILNDAERSALVRIL